MFTYIYKKTVIDFSKITLLLLIILIGFALETNNAIANAKKKLRAKNLDFIVLNTLQDEGAGFRHDTNKISIINKYNKIANFELKDKQLVAQDILNYLEEYLREMKEV